MTALRYTYLAFTYLPAITLGFFMLLVMAAYAVLGYAPIPSWNDPKDLGLDFLYVPTMLLVISWISWIPVWLTLFFLVRNQLDKQLQVKSITTFATGCIIFFLVFYLDPFDFVAWFFD